MKNKDLKIGTQLKVGFSIILLLVILFGLLTFIQTDKLFQSEETLYQHPMQVKEAFDDLKAEVEATRIGIRDLVIAEDDEKRQEAVQAIELSLAGIEPQFDTLYELYLGPVSDIDNAHDAFINWKTATEDRIAMARAGEIDNVIESLGDQGFVGVYRVQLNKSLEIIDNFANNKADVLHADYIAHNNALVKQHLILLIAILLISIIISVRMTQAIRKPLNTLNDDIKHFHQGDLAARCGYSKTDEFGALSASFNSMADAIQINMKLNEKAADLSDVMLSKEDAKEFFRSTLSALAEHAGSQTAAVYLLSADKNTYVHFESIGLGGKARDSFNAKDLEGEFGPAISSRKLQYITQIPDDTRFVFLTAGGQFIPREIITVPIVAGAEVIAVITLSSVNRFDDHATALIDSILDTMSARIEGILAFRTIKDFLNILEQQNTELDAQKNELTAQAAELTQQTQ